MTDLEARLALFANIEGGHTFWSSQIVELGALKVYEKLLSGGYDRVKYEKLITNLLAINIGQLNESLANAGSIFLTPDSPEWPANLNDLAATPIGLVVKVIYQRLTKDRWQLSALATQLHMAYELRGILPLALSTVNGTS